MDVPRLFAVCEKLLVYELFIPLLAEDDISFVHLSHPILSPPHTLGRVLLQPDGSFGSCDAE